MQSRRDFLTGSIAAVATIALCRAASSTGIVPASLRADINEFLAGLHEQTQQLRRGEAPTHQWRSSVGEFLHRVDFNDLLAAIDFKELAHAIPLAERGVSTSALQLDHENGERLSFISKIFAVGAGRSVIPHGHENMVSAHIVLDGQFHVRQFDKVATEQDALLIRQTVDRIDRAGAYSSIGLEDDNVHWLTAEGGPAYTLDIIVLGVDETHPVNFDILNIDPDAAVEVSPGILRAPRLSVAEALEKYG